MKLRNGKIYESHRVVKRSIFNTKFFGYLKNIWSMSPFVSYGNPPFDITEAEFKTYEPYIVYDQGTPDKEGNRVYD